MFGLISFCTILRKRKVVNGKMDGCYWIYGFVLWSTLIIERGLWMGQKKYIHLFLVLSHLFFIAFG